MAHNEQEGGRQWKREREREREEGDKGEVLFVASKVVNQLLLREC